MAVRGSTGMVSDRASNATPWSATRFYRWLVLPPLAFVAVFFLWPILTVIVRSFTDPTIGLASYVRIFSDGPYIPVLGITIKIATIVTLLCTVVAYPASYVISRARGSLFKVMIAFVVISLWTSVVIRSYAWMVVFQRNGMLNQLLVGLGIAERPIHFIPGTLAVNVGMVHIMLPFMILPMLSNMRSIDRSLLTAASVLGATPWQAFLRVFLPLSLPGLGAGAALVFMMSLGFFITPALLGGPRDMMAAVLIEQQANRLLEWGMASALSSVLLVLTIAIYLVYLNVMRRARGGLVNAY
ncbi:MAG: ABC transporter permease [Rhizobiaceae bacterium]